VVFVTGKKDGVTQRGRMGRGFKELLSIATHAAVRSRDQELCFTVGSDGVRRVTYRRGLAPHPGFEAVMEVEHDEAGKDLSSYFRAFLLPPRRRAGGERHAGPATAGAQDRRGPADHRALRPRSVGEARVRNLRPPGRCRGGEQPLIHEMGIPVCDAEWSEPFHVDVCQRVPMNPNRDAVQAGYPTRLHRACLL